MFAYVGSIQTPKDLKALERREDAGREASPVGPLDFERAQHRRTPRPTVDEPAVKPHW